MYNVDDYKFDENDNDDDDVGDDNDDDDVDDNISGFEVAVSDEFSAAFFLPSSLIIASTQ